MMYIILAILAFGLLIVIHELGHFAAAKAFHVKVLEFSVGMGPRLFKKQGRETLYSLRALPIGGSCLMEGEDAETGDTRSFTAQPRWKRFIILVAGALMNFLAGALVIFLLVSQASSFSGTTLTGLADGFPLQGEEGLLPGDTIVSINGERLYYLEDFAVFMSLAGNKPVDLVINRGGRTIQRNDFPLVLREYTQDGETVVRYGVTFNTIEATVGAKVKYAAYKTMNFVRLIRVSLSMLVSGSAGLKDLSGPVGIVSAINQVGQNQSVPLSERLANIAYFCAFIAINLAVFNLLPIPALDGGRIFFMAVTFVVEKLTRKHIDPKYEGYVHTAGFVLLMGLMLIVMFNDVVKLFNG
ncbi:M50 family metallopeptidase [Oscillospiraceae bacterium WX1]